MLRPIMRKNTVEIAIDCIGDYIINNLREGDVLPGEREIAERLKISRNITREALQHYRTLGIIESKPKVGATIARLMPEKAFNGYFPFLALMEHSFLDLAQLRLMLELGCAELAVKRATREDIAGLHALCEKIQLQFQEAKGGNADAYRELFERDFEFHSRFMRLSGNALIDSLIPLSVKFFSTLLRSQSPGKTLVGRIIGYQEHFSMVDALLHKDLDALQGLIRSHINAYLKAKNNVAIQPPRLL
ncbi:MAG: FadR family transcriptional regulator [Victivallales bacterium]|nr:FadR family transcriptional regulator [Victivallales bacterium]